MNSIRYWIPTFFGIAVLIAMTVKFLYEVRKEKKRRSK